jgi:hypothetical protein
MIVDTLGGICTCQIVRNKETLTKEILKLGFKTACYQQGEATENKERKTECTEISN